MSHDSGETIPTDSESVQMLWVERDLAAVCKAIFDNWDLRKEDLNHQYLFAASVRMSYNELVAVIEKGK